MDYDDTYLGKSSTRFHDTSLELPNKNNEGVDDNEKARRGAAVVKRGRRNKN